MAGRLKPIFAYWKACQKVGPRSYSVSVVVPEELKLTLVRGLHGGKFSDHLAWRKLYHEEKVLVAGDVWRCGELQKITHGVYNSGRIWTSCSPSSYH